MTEQKPNTTLSGDFDGVVAVGDGEAVDLHGSRGVIYKPSGPLVQHFGDGDVKQITFVIQGVRAEQMVAVGLDEVRCLLEEVRASLPFQGRWTVTESGEDRLAVESQFIVTAPLHFRLQSLIEDYIGLFAGREKEMAEIEAYLQRSEGGYVFVTGQSGFGKTTLLANLIAKARPPIRGGERTETNLYLYHFLSYLRGTHRREDMLRNLSQQMMAYYQLEGRLPSRTDDVEALYTKLLHLPLVREDRPFVLVIDGIDEAEHGFISNLHIPGELPAGKKIIFSARETGRNWLDELGIPRQRALVVTLERFDIHGVQQLLLKAGGHAESLAEDRTFVKQILDVSGGEPFYLRRLAEDIRDGVIGLDNIGRQPRGLIRYFDGWWRELSTYVREEEARQLLGLLLVARAPLPRSDILGVYPQLTWGLDGILQASRRFLVGDDEHGYALCHPRFREYLAQKLRRVVVPHRRALVDYCACWSKHNSTYALRYYVAHLAEIDDLKTLNNLLTLEWAEARHQIDGDYTGFLEDVQKTWQLADEKQDIGLQVRCALLKSTVHSLVADLSVDLILAAIQAKAWTPQVCLNYVYQISDMQQRIEAVSMIAPYLPPPLLKQALHQALETINEISLPHHKSSAVVNLATYLPPESVENALEITLGVSDLVCRSYALAALVPKVPKPLLPNFLQEVMNLIREKALESEFTYQCGTLDALIALSPYLPRELINTALLIVPEIKSEWYRSKTLAVLAPHLPSELMPIALEICHGIESEGYRTQALTALTSPRVLMSQDEIVRNSRAISNDVDNRYEENLGSLISDTTPESLRISLSKKIMIGDTTFRDFLLIRLAEQLEFIAADKNRKLRSRAIEVVKNLPWWERAYVTANLMPKFFKSSDLKAAYLDLNEDRMIRGSAFDTLKPLILEGYDNGMAPLWIAKIDDETMRAEEWQKMLAYWLSWVDNSPQFAYRAWIDVLHCLSNRPRSQLFWDLSMLVPIVRELGGKQSLERVREDVEDITKWWP